MNIAIKVLIVVTITLFVGGVLYYYNYNQQSTEEKRPIFSNKIVVKPKEDQTQHQPAATTTGKTSSIPSWQIELQKLEDLKKYYRERFVKIVFPQGVEIERIEVSKYDKTYDQSRINISTEAKNKIIKTVSCTPDSLSRLGSSIVYDYIDLCGVIQNPDGSVTLYGIGLNSSQIVHEDIESLGSEAIILKEDLAISVRFTGIVPEWPTATKKLIDEYTFYNRNIEFPSPQFRELYDIVLVSLEKELKGPSEEVKKGFELIGQIAPTLQKALQ